MNNPWDLCFTEQRIFFGIAHSVGIPTLVLLQFLDNIVYVSKLSLIARFIYVDISQNVLFIVFIGTNTNLTIVVIVLGLWHRNAIEILAEHAFWEVTLLDEITFQVLPINILNLLLFDLGVGELYQGLARIHSNGTIKLPLLGVVPKLVYIEIGGLVLLMKLGDDKVLFIEVVFVLILGLTLL